MIEEVTDKEINAFLWEQLAGLTRVRRIAELEKAKET